MLSKRYRITCDTDIENSFMVHNWNGKNVKFLLSDEGLYYHDVRWNCELATPEKPKSHQKRTNVLNNTKNVILVNTVDENEEGYTKKELHKARLAKHMYILMG